MKKTEEEEVESLINEYEKGHIDLLKYVINIIKLNQMNVLEVRDNEEGDNELFKFHNGGIAFGNVIINEVKKVIKLRKAYYKK